MTEIDAPVPKMKSKLLSHFKKEGTKRTNMYIPLVFLVVSTLIISVLSVGDLQWEDKISIRRGFMLFLYGLVFFTSLYHALNSIFTRTAVGQKFVKSYKLSLADVYDISNKIVSAVQALFCCITGLTCCCYSCFRDILKTSHYISEAYAWFGAAYFAYDIWSMYKVQSAKIVHVQMNGDSNKRHKELNSSMTFWGYVKSHAVIVGHHVFIGAFGFLVITYLRGGLGDCFFGFVYLMEASTPFVSARGILSKVGLKSSNLYVVNGLVMLATFFVCRVAMFPCVIYLYAQSVGLDYFSAIHSLPRGCKVSMLILLLPQIYWFHLMLKGATQVLSGKSSDVSVTAKKKPNTTKNSHS